MLKYFSLGMNEADQDVSNMSPKACLLPLAKNHCLASLFRNKKMKYEIQKP